MAWIELLALVEFLCPRSGLGPQPQSSGGGSLEAMHGTSDLADEHGSASDFWCKSAAGSWCS